MAKKKRGPIELIYVGGKPHRLTLFRVLSRDDKGRPLECERIDDKRTVTLEGGEEFMTAYVPAHMIGPDLPVNRN